MNAVKTQTRYKVTVNQQESWRDDMPNQETLERMEVFITNRGGHAKIEECTTTLDESKGWGEGRLHTESKTIFEIEG